MILHQPHNYSYSGPEYCTQPNINVQDEADVCLKHLILLLEFQIFLALLIVNTNCLYLNLFHVSSGTFSFWWAFNDPIYIGNSTVVEMLHILDRKKVCMVSVRLKSTHTLLSFE